MSGHKRPSLTEQEKQIIQTLTAEGRSPNYISKEIGRSRNTVTKYLQSSPSVLEKIQEQREDLAEQFKSLAQRLVVSITDADIQKSSALQRLTGAGICVDKSRLLENLSTSNQAVIILNVPDTPEQYRAMCEARKKANEDE